MIKYIAIPPDKWKIFIETACENSKYFSLTLFSGCPASSTPEYECTINELEPWIIDRNEAIWGEYEKKFYQCNYFTKKIILTNGIDMLTTRKYPENLCFYNDMGMWFENVSHESYSFIILPECRITARLQENGMIIF